MKVNVITHWDPAKIKGRKRGAIHRMARYLAAIPGWELSGGLDHAAAVNYVLDYSDGWKEDAAPWSKYAGFSGFLAGYFTHREPVGIKHRLWTDAAATVDLRISQAVQNMPGLGVFGPTAHVPLPVEREHFTMAARVVRARPRVGVSGYNSRTGRKGAQLVYELAHYPGRGDWSLVAAGRGWPIKSCLYTWQELPTFYQSLDVYLCTSLLEGGPLGVFEALSCGVPVVIPRGVGSLDELPAVVGIYRYDCGSFDQMCDMIEAAIAALGAHDRPALRATTAGLTPQAFRDAHVKLFEGGI